MSRHKIDAQTPVYEGYFHMTIAEAIAAFQRLDPRAVLVIDGTLVQGVEGPVNGRIKDGYGVQNFTVVEKGREKAVFFTRWSEQSDGERVERRF